MYYIIQAANNKGADQTARMRRLICVFVVHIWHNRFSHGVAHLMLLSWFLQRLSRIFRLLAKTHDQVWYVSFGGI